jgi:hypothetical protein
MSGTITRRLLPLLLFAAAAPAFGQNADWRPVGAPTGQLSSVRDLQSLAADFPDSASVQLRLLNALADAGDTDSAGRLAVQLAARGYAFGPESEQAIAGMLDPDFAELFRTATEAARRPVERSRVIGTIPAEALLVESVARDPKTGWLYATTVVSRDLWVKRGDTPWEPIAIDGAGSLSGIAWDVNSGLFWIASGNFEQTPGGKAQSALLGFDPKTGTVERRLYANGSSALGDVAVGIDGTVYVSDPEQGIIHYAPPRGSALRALVGPGVFRSPQGMVAIPYTDLLIVSDYRYGLAVLDTENGRVRRITGGGGYFLDGIDALQLDGKSLLAVQNGHNPKRILRIDMNRDWLGIARIAVLESGVSGWTEPVGGTLDKDDFLYVGTGQWDRFGEGGAVLEGANPGPTEIRSLPLGE